LLKEIVDKEEEKVNLIDEIEQLKNNTNQMNEYIIELKEIDDNIQTFLNSLPEQELQRLNQISSEFSTSGTQTQSQQLISSGTQSEPQQLIKPGPPRGQGPPEPGPGNNSPYSSNNPMNPNIYEYQAFIKDPNNESEYRTLVNRIY